MVFRPPPRETIQLLRSILQNLENATDNKDGDLAYLKRLMLERIAELEATQNLQSSKAGASTHREAA